METFSGLKIENAELKKMYFDSYWTFEIACTTNLHAEELRQISPNIELSKDESGKIYFLTLQRYDDFKLFYGYLSKEVTEFIIPPFPEGDISGYSDRLVSYFHSKTNLNGSQMTFYRRLQLFLNYLIKIENMQENKIFKFFFIIGKEKWKKYCENELRDIKYSPLTSFKNNFSDYFKNIFGGNSYNPNFVATKCFEKNLMIGNNLIKASNCIGEIIENVYKIVKPSNNIEQINSPAANLFCTPYATVGLYHKLIDKNGEKEGIVRHIAGNNIWLENEKDKTISRYFCSDLMIPSDGISDPVIQSCNIFSHQLDSLFSSQKDPIPLNNLFDQLWFWGAFCLNIANKFETYLKNYKILEDELAKTSYKNSESEKIEKIRINMEKYQSGLLVNKIFNDYKANFVPKYNAAMIEIIKCYVKLSSSILLNNDWDTRLKKTDILLNYEMSLPQLILKDINLLNPG